MKLKKYIIVLRKIYSKITTNISEKYIAKIRGKNLYNKNFSIISNNCWAGWVYRRFNLPYLTPTVGLFIMPSDYIKLIKNLKKYMDLDLKFILPDDSKHKEYIKSHNIKFGTYPIGILGNEIEIHFLHYNSNEEAYKKWNKRKERINYNNLIFKFNDQNGCTKKDYVEFKNINLKNKIFFTSNKSFKDEFSIYIKEYSESNFVEDDMLFCTKYLKLTKYLNELKGKE